MTKEKTREELLAENKELKEFIANIAHSTEPHERVKLGNIDVNTILHNLIENMPSTVFVKDLNSRFVLCSNTVAKQMGGKSARDMIGKSDFDFYDKEYALAFRHDEIKVMEEGQPVIGKDEAIIINGKLKAWVLTTKIPLRDEKGNIIGLIGIAHDISERKRIEEERDKVIADLHDAIDKIKTLDGLLPICAHCKKVRDDGGYWHEVEAYIKDRSRVNFSHGICPQCAEKYYAEYLGELKKTDDAQCSDSKSEGKEDT